MAGVAVVIGSMLLASVGAVHASVDQNLRVVEALYQEVAERLLRHKQVFGENEVLLTLGTLGSEPELQVQFAPNRIDECAVWLRYVPRSEESVYQRLFDVVRNQPTISAEEAAAGFRLVEETRSIPCDSPLGILTREVNDLTLALESPIRERTAFIHALTYRMEVRSPDLRITAEFPSALDLPVVSWVNAVRREVLRLLESPAGGGER